MKRIDTEDTIEVPRQFVQIAKDAARLIRTFRKEVREGREAHTTILNKHEFYRLEEIEIELHDHLE